MVRAMSLMNGVREALLHATVIAPIRVARNRLSDKVWAPLEVASRCAGWLAGLAVRPLVLAGSSPDDRLRALLRFTELVEEPLGILGTNELVDDLHARRTIRQCPLAARITDVPEFCTSIGGCAAKGAMAAIVPGAEFTVLRTKSRGDAECLYEYRVPRA